MPKDMPKYSNPAHRAALGSPAKDSPSGEKPKPAKQGRPKAARRPKGGKKKGY